MIPYGRQNLNRGDKLAVARILNSDWLTQGPAGGNFEEALAQRVGAKYAVAVSSGTAALHLAYLAASIGQADEVITSPNTFVATTNMLLAVGAKPIFADIRLDSYNLDETQIENLITKKTRAIVPVDFAGHPCEMNTLRRLAKKHGLILISDSAHSLGARYRGKPVGSLADLTIFSFHPVKTITTGEGGAVVTNNKKYYERLKLLRNHGIHKDKNGFNVMTDLGYNYRLTDFQAALGRSQLRRLRSFLRTRHQVAHWYQQLLKSCGEIILPIELPHIYSGWHIYVIRVKDPRQRLPLMRWLIARGIGANFHYPQIYRHPFYRARGYKALDLPNADLYHQTAITLPLHTKLNRRQVQYIARCIKEFFAQ